MGRMLELLKTRDATRPAPTTNLSDTNGPAKVAGGEVVNEWSMKQDEVPFIEVGPNRSVAGSPSVMSVSVAAPPRHESPRHEPPQPVQPPHPPTEQAIVSTKLLEPRPIAVNFEPYTGLSLGAIGSEIIAYHQPSNAISQQYAALAEKLVADELGKVLLLSGVRSRVGTSTVLLNLAVSAAMTTQKRVAVVETQRHRPSLAGKLGLKPLAFLQDVLGGVVSIEQALLKSPLPRLALLAASATHPEIVLATEGLTWLLGWLKHRNDLVLVDGPSLDDQVDLPRLAPLSDSMFVVMPQSEPTTQSRGLLPVINRIGGRLRGLLHTQLVG